jgi:hypothetical protein
MQHVPHESSYVDIAHEYEKNAVSRGRRGGLMHRDTGKPLKPRRAMAMIAKGDGHLVDNSAFAFRRASSHAKRLARGGSLMPHSPDLPASERQRYADIIRDSSRRSREHALRASEHAPLVERALGVRNRAAVKQYMDKIHDDVY